MAATEASSPNAGSCPGKLGFRFHTRPDLCQGILSTCTSAIPLEIKESSIEGAGSGLFAVGDLEAGCEIFRSQPLVNCRDPTVTHICDFCLVSSKAEVHPDGHFRTEDEELPTIKPCSGCRVARYCSQSCQKKAWKRYHKFECSILKETPRLPPTSLALYRILCLDNEGKVPEGTWIAIQGLESSFDKYDETENMNDMMYFAIQAGSRISGLKHDLQVVWPLACRLFTNCMNIRPADIESSIGCSLNLMVAMMNHQCNPNAHVFFEGNQVRARSLRRINNGDEIFVSYADPRMDVLRRREFLKQTQFIDCKCRKCIHELKIHASRGAESADQLNTLYHAQVSMAKTIGDASVAFFVYIGQNGQGAIDKYSEAISTIKKKAYPPSGDWPDNVDPLPLARLIMAGVCQTEGDFVAALRNALKACLLSGHRHGHPWVMDLLELTRIFVRIGQKPNDTPVFDGKILPERQYIRLTTVGYMQELCVASSRAFGQDTALTMAILKWAAVFRHMPGQPPPDHPEFRQRFDNAQLRCLEWAGIETSKGLSLPDIAEIEKLGQGLMQLNLGMSQ